MKKSFGLGAAAFTAVTLLVGGTAQAAGFPDKNIEFIIPYGPGGGFDTYVRRLAPVVQKYLPNKVNVIPRNVAGAGGRKAAAVLYLAKPDGYQIAIFNIPGMLLDRILGKKTIYDMEKFVWLCRVAREPYALAVSTKGPYNSVADLQKAKELKYAVTSPSSTSYVAGKIMAHALGMPVTFLTGYKGSAKISLSLIRGDTQLSLFAVSSYAKYARSGDLKAVLVLDNNSPFKGVPTAAEVGHPELTALATGRYIGTSPGTPPKIAKVLETALMKAMASKEIQSWSKKTNHSIDPLDGAAAAKRLKHLVTYFSKYKSVLAAKN